jgi:hypothetical protein
VFSLLRKRVGSPTLGLSFAVYIVSGEAVLTLWYQKKLDDNGLFAGWVSSEQWVLFLMSVPWWVYKAIKPVQPALAGQGSVIDLSVLCPTMPYTWSLLLHMGLILSPCVCLQVSSVEQCRHSILLSHTSPWLSSMP